jgi:hypothetical protein
VEENIGKQQQVAHIKIKKRNVQSKRSWGKGGRNTKEEKITGSSLGDDERDTIELHLVDDTVLVLPHRQILLRISHG